MENQVEEKIRKIFNTILGIDDSEIINDLSAKDIEEWYSKSHLIMLTAIEKEFNISFEMKLIPELNTFAKIVEKTKELIK